MYRPAKRNPVSARGDPDQWIDDEQVQERSRGGDGCESGESPNVADPGYHRLAIDRPNHNPAPKACADRADLGRRETFEAAAHGQKRGLQRVAYLHEPIAEQERKQGWQRRPHRSIHPTCWAAHSETGHTRMSSNSREGAGLVGSW
jgi:hypothetical protein